MSNDKVVPIGQHHLDWFLIAWNRLVLHSNEDPTCPGCGNKCISPKDCTCPPRQT